MTYKAEIRDAIYAALLEGPLFLKDLADKVGYSYTYICAQVMWIRRDTSLDWNVAFLGHGNNRPTFLVKRGHPADEIRLNNGHLRWLATLDNKCLSIQKECTISGDTVVSPAAKAMYSKAKLYLEMAEETIQKAKLA